MSFSLAINLPPPPKKFFIASHNRPFARWRHFTTTTRILFVFLSCLNLIKIPARFKNKNPNLHKKAKPWRLLVVVVKWRHRANDLFSLFGCLEQSFPEGIIKPYEGPILASAKSAASNIFLYFVSFRDTGERLIPGLRQKDWILQASLLAVTSLWTHKEGSKGEIHSGRLMLISDQAKDLVKNCFEGGGLHVSFSTSGLHPGSWINRLFESRKVSCDDLCGESERFSVGVIWRCFARVKCGNIMSGFRKCCDFREIYCVITEVVDSYMVEKTLCQA